MRNCLITGVNGLIGSNLANALLENNWQVFGVGRRSSALNEKIKYTELDLSREWSDAKLPSSVEAVIHLAQSPHYRDFPNSAESLFNVNTVSTLRLLDYARKVNAKTFILASSGGVYEESDEYLTEDNHKVISFAKHNSNFYVASKVCSEIISESYASLLNIVTLRFFFVYGQPQMQSMLIPRLIHSVANDIPITLQGSEGLKINPTYVDDAVKAIQTGLELNESHTINIAGPEVLSLKEISEIIGKHLNKKPIYQTNEDSPKKLIGDTRKMSDLLMAPTTQFATGLKYMLSSDKRTC